MIKYISTPNPELLQSNGGGNSGPYHSGHVMWDGNGQKFKVIDSNGTTQDMYGASVSIEAGYKLKEMVAWYEQKRLEEDRIKELCKQYPNLDEARKEFEIIYNIVKEHK